MAAIAVLATMAAVDMLFTGAKKATVAWAQGGRCYSVPLVSFEGQ